MNCIAQLPMYSKVSISNPDDINLKFYGAGIYNYNEKLYFVGGKTGKGNDDIDYIIYRREFSDWEGEVS